MFNVKYLNKNYVSIIKICLQFIVLDVPAGLLVVR